MSGISTLGKIVAALKRGFPEKSGIATIPIAAIDIAIVSPQNANDMSSPSLQAQEICCCSDQKKPARQRQFPNLLYAGLLDSRLALFLHDMKQ